ncbi:MAG: YraN family protein [Clostridiales bacterium]|nr:YraN family protein [Clostridiales bacterium]
MFNYNKVAGNAGEGYVCAYLQNEGYKIIATQHVDAGAEVDIIAEKGEILAFVEVKMRASMENGMPNQAVDKRKQAKIRRVAQYYLLKNNIRDKVGRFDVAEIIGNIRTGQLCVDKFNYYKNAF